MLKHEKPNEIKTSKWAMLDVKLAFITFIICIFYACWEKNDLLPIVKPNPSNVLTKSNLKNQHKSQILIFVAEKVKKP
jgi:hypothetical protein